MKHLHYSSGTEVKSSLFDDSTTFMPESSTGRVLNESSIELVAGLDNATEPSSWKIVLRIKGTVHRKNESSRVFKGAAATNLTKGSIKSEYFNLYVLESPSDLAAFLQSAESLMVEVYDMAAEAWSEAPYEILAV